MLEMIVMHSQVMFTSDCVLLLQMMALDSFTHLILQKKMEAYISQLIRSVYLAWNYSTFAAILIQF